MWIVGFLPECRELQSVCSGKVIRAMRLICCWSSEFWLQLSEGSKAKQRRAKSDGQMDMDRFLSDNPDSNMIR